MSMQSSTRPCSTEPKLRPATCSTAVMARPFQPSALMPSVEPRGPTWANYSAQSTRPAARPSRWRQPRGRPCAGQEQPRPAGPPSVVSSSPLARADRSRSQRPAAGIRCRDDRSTRELVDQSGVVGDADVDDHVAALLEGVYVVKAEAGRAMQACADSAVSAIDDGEAGSALWLPSIVGD